MIVCQDPRMAERAVIPLIITTASLPFHCKLGSLSEKENREVTQAYAKCAQKIFTSE